MKQFMESSSTTQNFNNLVALFLAEAIRSRRTSLSRAAEISQRVIAGLPNLDSESRALEALTEVEKDFQEISTLKQALHFGYEPSEIRVYESEIKDFASKIFTKNINLSAAFLQDAAKPGTTIQQLCIKYPDFCDFLLSCPDKAAFLPKLKA